MKAAYHKLHKTAIIYDAQYSIIIYDYADQSYHAVEIISLRHPGKPELEVYDYDADEYRNFEMEESVKGHASSLLIKQQITDHS